MLVRRATIRDQSQAGGWNGGDKDPPYYPGGLPVGKPGVQPYQKGEEESDQKNELELVMLGKSEEEESDTQYE